MPSNEFWTRARSRWSWCSTRSPGSINKLARYGGAGRPHQGRGGTGRRDLMGSVSKEGNLRLLCARRINDHRCLRCRLSRTSLLANMNDKRQENSQDWDCGLASLLPTGRTARRPGVFPATWQKSTLDSSAPPVPSQFLSGGNPIERGAVITYWAALRKHIRVSGEICIWAEIH